MKNGTSTVLAIVLGLLCLIFLGVLHSRETTIKSQEKTLSIQDILIETQNLRYQLIKEMYENTDSALDKYITIKHQKVEIRKKILNIKPYIRAKHLDAITDSIHKYANEFDLDSNLILALIYTESRFDPYATSVVGAQGLMQVMPFWRHDLDFIESRKDLYDIDKNIKAGVVIYKRYLAKFDSNHELALLAYNRGPDHVLHDLRRGYNPSNGYEVAVLAKYRQLGE